MGIFNPCIGGTAISVGADSSAIGREAAIKPKSPLYQADSELEYTQLTYARERVMFSQEQKPMAGKLVRLMQERLKGGSYMKNGMKRLLPSWIADPDDQKMSHLAAKLPRFPTFL